MGTVTHSRRPTSSTCASRPSCYTTHQNIGCEAPGGDNELEVLLLVDRADASTTLDKFYVFEQSPGGELAHPQALAPAPPLPEGWSIVGRLVTVTLPFVRSSMPAQGGWLELDDDIF